ncbi:hypothetical protein Aduo_014645 [Ancylostoma duodenale]
MQMDVLLLFLVYALLVVNVVSKCSKKKSDKSESRKKRKRHRDRGREPKGSPPKDQLPVPPEPVMVVTTAHEAEDTQSEEMFRCRDYTPAIFNELQNLFDLLKQSS